MSPFPCPGKIEIKSASVVCKFGGMVKCHLFHVQVKLRSNETIHYMAMSIGEVNDGISFERSAISIKERDSGDHEINSPTKKISYQWRL